MTDWGSLYAEHVAALEALAWSLDEDVLAGPVPGTPLWSVSDVFRHLAGVAADTVNGDTDGAPGPAWTENQVTSRAGVSATDAVTELRGHVGEVVALVEDNPAPAVVWDVVVHHADLHEALGRPRMAEHLWQPVLDAVAPRVLGRKQVTVSTGDAVYGGGGEPVVADPYELFRTLFSRRSRGQIEAWAGDALDPDEICIFGAREDDQPVP